MSTTKDRLKQTCKTILFEEFDSDKIDLATILKNNDPTKGAFGTELEKLEVSSFNEFLEKFAPDVYEICERNGDGKPEFIYTTDKSKIQGRYAVKQSITDHAYYKMLSDLYYQKGNSGESNLQFDDTKILEMLTPKQEVEEARDIRKSLQYNFEKYQELKENGENPSEYAQQIIDDREKIVNKYKDSKMGLLPLVIDDAKAKLKLLDKVAPAQNSDTKAISYVSGKLTFTPEGDLTVEPVKSIEINDDKESEQRPSIGNTITALLERDYDAAEENKNDFVKSLVVSVYSPMGDENELTTLSSEELALKRQAYEKRIEAYEAMYVNAKQSFIDEMTAVLEKLLDVKVFFNHATIDGKDDSKLKTKVIVSNCKADKLLTNSVRSRFETFVQDRGINETDENKIWFAILPAIKDKGMAIGNEEIDPLAPVMGQKNKEEKLTSSNDYISFNTAKDMLNLLNDNRIMTVFNFKANKNNGFGEIDAKYISDKKKQMENMNYDHAVFAYPNFTLTRERNIKLGNEEIRVPGVYIDAAYPAAGLLVASQQTDFLEKHGFKGRVNRNNICVHVDLEDDEVKKNLVTKFNRELATRWNRSIIDEIGSEKFGFVFNGDGIYVDGEQLKNTYVYFARTLKKDDGTYVPIYQVLMKDFILQYLNSGHSGDKVNEKEINNFKKDVVAWKKEANPKTVNCILKPDEDISVEEEKDDNNKVTKYSLTIKFVESSMMIELEIN